MICPVGSKCTAESCFHIEEHSFLNCDVLEPDDKARGCQVCIPTNFREHVAEVTRCK